MDVNSPSPPKRSRIMETALVQQNKSTQLILQKKKLLDNVKQRRFTKVQRVLSIKSKQPVDSLQSIPYSGTMKFVPNKEMNISNKLQKLRLKSPDGRDLGEINVKLFPQQVDNIGGKTITLKKHSVLEKRENQQSAISILKPMSKKVQQGMLINMQPFAPQSLSGTGIVSPSTSNCVPLSKICAIKSIQQGTLTTNAYSNTEQKINSEETRVMFRHFNNTKCKAMSSVPSNSKVILVKVDKQPGLVKGGRSMQENVKNVIESPTKSKVVTVKADNYPHLNSAKKNTACSTLVELRSYRSNKGSGSAGNITSDGTNNWKIVEIMSKATNQETKMIVTQSVANSKCDKQSTEKKNTIQELINMHESATISSSKPLTIVKTYGRAIENGAKSNCNEDVKETQTKSMEVTKIVQRNCSKGVVKPKSENTQCVTVIKNSAMTVEKQSKQGEKDSAVIEDKSKTKTCKVDENETGVKETEESKKDKNIRENIMVILHGDANTLSNNENSKSVPEEDTNTMEVDVEMSGDANSCSEGHQEGETIAEASNLDKVGQENNADILEKALSTLPDQEMREKALKALADCGIGVKRLVPVSRTVSVNDSQTQTQVFCLWKAGMLVEVNESSPLLNYLPVTNTPYLTLGQPCENNPITQQPNDLAQINATDLFISDSLCSSSNDFFSLLAEHVPETATSNVNTINGILSKPDPKIFRIFEQLEKDYKAATIPDPDGFTGIHRAVLSGNIKEVRRQLIVLKALRENIDLPTSTGKTSLELAVSHDVNPDIVRCLLNEGAKPAFPMKLHESALVIACKLSSQVVPDLIKHVNPPTLLDILDSEGFAPLHYCAQLGNSDAVRMLVNAGANLNLQDAKSGRTPLFHALENRYIELAWHLVENGASLNITNFAGQSPSALVDEYRHNALAEKFSQLER